MNRLSLPIWLIIIVFAGVCMFHVKFAVQELEAQLTLTNRQVQQGEEALRVLRAEWSYLNEPSRLADLNQRHLGLVPVAAGQMVDLDALPVRVAPPVDADALPPLEEIPGADAPIASAPPTPITPVAVMPTQVPAIAAPAAPTAAPAALPVAAAEPVSAPATAASAGPTAADAAALTDLISAVEAKP